MLGLDNPTHLALLFVLLLLVFGAKRLPELGRSLGSGLRGFKESISGDPDPAQLAPTTVANSSDVREHTEPAQPRPLSSQPASENARTDADEQMGSTRLS